MSKVSQVLTRFEARQVTSGPHYIFNYDAQVNVTDFFEAHLLTTFQVEDEEVGGGELKPE